MYLVKPKKILTIFPNKKTNKLIFYTRTRIMQSAMLKKGNKKL